MTKKYRVVVAACAAILASKRAAYGTDYSSSWNTTAGDWSNAANWLNNPPIVAFPNNANGDTYEVTVEGVGVGTTQLTLTQDITVSSLSFNDSTLIGNTSGGRSSSMIPTLNVLGNFDDATGNTFALTNYAILNLEGASVLSNATAITGDADTALNIISGGTLSYSGTSAATVSVPFNNSGAVLVNGGTLSLQGGGSGAGSITVASGATLEVASTNYYTGNPTYFTGGAVANNGLLNISRLGNATFTTISGTGTLTMPGAPATLNANSIAQGTMIVDGGTIALQAPSTVTNLTLTAYSGNPVFNGSAPDNTSVPNSTVSLNVNGVFNGAANFTLNKGFILNLAGTGSFSGNNDDGGTNAQINILPGAVIQHNVSSTTYIDDALTTVNGELDVTAGSFIINYGGTHAGTFNVAAGALAQVGGGFTTAATVNDSGTFSIIPSGGPDSDPAYPGYTGHNFNGTLNVQPNATLGFQGIGLPGGVVFFTNQSTVNMGPATTLTVISGTTVLFNNQQALNIGTANLGGGAIFRNPGLNIGVATLSTGITKFENTGTVTIGTFNQTGLVSDNILRTGQEDNLATTLSVGTFNLSGGQESGLVSVTGAMNWTGGIINADYGHVIIQPGASLSISGTGGTISQSGKLDVSGTTYSANNLTDSGETANSLLNFYAATTTIDGNLALANTGSVTGGSSTANVVATIAAAATVNVTKAVILGNTSGGDAEVRTAGRLTASGIQVNDVTVSAGTVSITTDTKSADNIDPVLNGSIVGGYERDGQLNVNGGNVSAPYMKLGITSGNTGTFNQTAGTVTLGLLGGGNDGSLSSGMGKGMINISGGNTFIGTVLLASTQGGAADMNLSGNANVVIGGGANGGGAHLNDITVDGGSLTVMAVTASNPQPAGEDPELAGAIVGGEMTDGQLNVNGGSVTAPYLKFGITSGNTGTFNMTGGVVNAGTLTGGNDGNLNDGQGTGMINISGGTSTFGTVLLASTQGGHADLTISGTANVTIGGGGNGGGAHLNDLTLDGGYLNVMAVTPTNPQPAGEDTELAEALVGGYLTNGAFNVYGGVASTPYLKLGISSGLTGTFIQQAGTVGLGTLCVGDDVTTASGSGIGSVVLSGGMLSIGTLLVGSTSTAGAGMGTVNITGTAAVRVTNAITMVAGQSSLTVSGGSLTLDGVTAALASNAIPIGDGTQTTMLHLHNSSLAGSGANLTIAAHATVDGGGGDLAGEAVGSVSLSGTSLTLSNGATLHVALGGDSTQTGAAAIGTAGTDYDQISESNGIFTVGGATLQILPLSGFVLNQKYPIVVANTASAGLINDTTTFANLTTDPNSSYPYATYTVNYSVTASGSEIDVTFTSAPEPSGAALLLGVSGFLTLRRRRAEVLWPAMAKIRS